MTIRLEVENVKTHRTSSSQPWKPDEKKLSGYQLDEPDPMVLSEIESERERVEEGERERNRKEKERK